MNFISEVDCFLLSVLGRSHVQNSKKLGMILTRIINDLINESSAN